MKKLLVAFIFFSAIQATADHHVLNMDELIAKLGWDFETAEVRTEKIGDGLYVLFGIGGNIAVSVGDDGVLIVDDQFPEMVPNIEAAIDEVGGHGVDFVINTHWHFDHAEGNMALGPAGTKIIAQEKARTDMAKGGVINMVKTKYGQQPYPADALPQITFDDNMHMHYNGERIDLMHFGPAHTTGDTAVIFRGHNAVHMGDVFNNTGYPFVDADNGGDIDGMITFCQAALDQLNSDTVVIPGHGAVSDYASMKAYIEMLSTVRDRVSKMIDKGKTLDEISASNPTSGYEERYGDVSNSLGFINRVYTSLVKKRR
jgi:cyclase